MINKIRLSVFLVFLCTFNCVCAMALSFEDFKSNIVGKSGDIVRSYITPKIHQGLDSQVCFLHEHMIERGHFGTRDSFSGKKISAKWSSFLIKPDGSFILDNDEQKRYIKDFWNSKELIYSGDIPGCDNGVYLNCPISSVPGVKGVFFREQKAFRSSMQKRDFKRYKKENKLAVRIINLGRAPLTSDFVNQDEFQIAQEVFAAKPYFVDTCSFRVILKPEEQRVIFNTVCLFTP